MEPSALALPSFRIPAPTLMGPRSVFELSVLRLRVSDPTLARVSPEALLMTPKVRSPKPPTEAVEPRVSAPVRLAAVALLFQSAALFAPAIAAAPVPLMMTFPVTPVRPLRSRVPLALKVVAAKVAVVFCEMVNAVALVMPVM